MGESQIRSQSEMDLRSFEGQVSQDLTQLSQKGTRENDETDRIPGGKRVRADSFGEGPS